MSDREQQFHIKQSSYLTAINAWLETMPTETNSEEEPIHEIQQFQILPFNNGESYQATVLCNHNKKED